MIRLMFLLAFAIVCARQVSCAQGIQYEQSVPLNLERTGVNKVLCMKNGNTMLFHFEPNKPITVKVFDSLRKPVATREHVCRLLDINMLSEATFKGLFEINNEAVLFMEQEHLNRYVLVRLRFSSRNGDLLEEKFAGESQSQTKRTRYYVMSEKGRDAYAIFFCTDIPQFKECRLNVTYYNKRHEVQREVSLPVDRRRYDALDVLAAERRPQGTFIALDLKTEKGMETYHSGDGIDPQWVGLHSIVNVNQVQSLADPHHVADRTELDGTITYDHDVHLFYIPADSMEAKKKVMNLTTNLYPYYANFSYNAFANSINLLLLSYREYNFKFGIDVQPGALKSSLFFAVDEGSMDIAHKLLKNRLAVADLKKQAGNRKSFEGLPVSMFTNENGLSTVVSRAYSRYRNSESFERPVVYESYFNDLCITQLDDSGNELWGAVLPGAQYLKSYRHYYYADELSRAWQDQALFLDMPPQVYERQFLLQNIYSHHDNFYIIYNDYNKNFSNSLKKPGDTVFDFENTNVCCYKISRKKEVTKAYLFGQPARNEFKTSFIEGADFDEQRGVYAALIQRKRGDNISLHMAWAHLE